MPFAIKIPKAKPDAAKPIRLRVSLFFVNNPGNQLIRSKIHPIMLQIVTEVIWFILKGFSLFLGNTAMSDYPCECPEHRLAVKGTY
jgi:hypothetical protein